MLMTHMKPWDYAKGLKEHASVCSVCKGDSTMPDYSVNTPDTVQCAFYSTLDGRTILNSTTMRRTFGSPDAVQAQTLADQMAVFWRVRILPHLSHRIQAEQAIVVPLNGDFSLIRGSTAPQQLGGEMGVSLPNNVGFRLEMHTGLPGRAYRGWTTFVGIPAHRVTDNTIDTAWADDLVSAWAFLGPTVNALGWEWVVTSTHDAGVPRATGITTPITTVTYKDLIVDSCRHRLPNRRFS